MRNTYIAYNNEVKPLTETTLSAAMKFKLNEQLTLYESKLKRARNTFTKLTYRSRIAELNQKLLNV